VGFMGGFTLWNHFFFFFFNSFVTFPLMTGLQVVLAQESYKGVAGASFTLTLTRPCLEL